LLLNTLPHWAGVTFITASEKRGDMWIRGEQDANDALSDREDVMPTRFPRGEQER
jgi:hypothetical protein